MVEEKEKEQAETGGLKNRAKNTKEDQAEDQVEEEEEEKEEEHHVVLPLPLLQQSPIEKQPNNNKSPAAAIHMHSSSMPTFTPFTPNG